MKATGRWAGYSSSPTALGPTVWSLPGKASPRSSKSFPSFGGRFEPGSRIVVWPSSPCSEGTVGSVPDYVRMRDPFRRGLDDPASEGYGEDRWS